MTVAEALEIWERDYLSATGLTRIDINDRAQAPNGVESVHNENGILCTADTLSMACRKVGTGPLLKYKKRVQDAILSVRRSGIDGLINRQPELNTRYEAHDNPMAVVFLGALYGDTTQARAMIKWFWHHWFCFNNVDPKKWKKEQIRQPGDIAVCYIVAGLNPPWFLFLWFLVGLIINARNSKSTPGQAKLARLRIHACDLAGGPNSLFKRFLFESVVEAWQELTIEKFGSWSYIYTHWYPRAHPVNLMEQA